VEEKKQSSLGTQGKGISGGKEVICLGKKGRVTKKVRHDGEARRKKKKIYKEKTD